MALILKYRVDPPAEVNQAVYAALIDQVGKVGITIQMPLGDDGKTQLSVTGEFISVAGEHYPDRDCSSGGQLAGESRVIGDEVGDI
jgi:hypothetical protein